MVPDPQQAIEQLTVEGEQLKCANIKTSHKIPTFRYEIQIGSNKNADEEPQFWPFSTPLCSESKIGACDFLSQKHGTEGEVDIKTKSGKYMYESQSKSC